jgi:hypothetical protein
MSSVLDIDHFTGESLPIVYLEFQETKPWSLKQKHEPSALFLRLTTIEYYLPSNPSSSSSTWNDFGQYAAAYTIGPVLEGCFTTFTKMVEHDACTLT